MTDQPEPDVEAEVEGVPAPTAAVEPGPVLAAAPPQVAGRRTGIAWGAVIGLVAAIALAFGGGFLVGRGTAPEAGGPAQTAVAAASAGSAAPAPSSRYAGLESDGTRLGRADAAVVIEYWADYQCPFCSAFARDVIPQLRSRIADGTVALVHRDFAFLGAESFDAAVAVRCADAQGGYWTMHDAVYAGQQGENQGAFVRQRLLGIAAAAGLDAGAIEACLDTREPLVSVLDDTAAGRRAGIESTPTIDVNGTRFLGVPDTTAFLAAIDDAAAGASPGVLPTPAPSTDAWSAIDTDARARTAGAADAPVTVELWMDYQAADANAVAQELSPQLRDRIDAGEIRAELHDAATLGEESVVAASFLRCVAAQGGPAWFVNDILAVSARGAGSGIYTADNLLRLAAQLGLEVRPLDACMADEATAAAVRAETADGAATGITAGPTVVVRRGGTEIGRFTGPLDVAAITKAIDGAE